MGTDAGRTLKETRTVAMACTASVLLGVTPAARSPRDWKSKSNPLSYEEYQGTVQPIRFWYDGSLGNGARDTRTSETHGRARWPMLSTSAGELLLLDQQLLARGHPLISRNHLLLPSWFARSDFLLSSSRLLGDLAVVPGGRVRSG